MIDNNENTKITEKDLLFIEKELSQTNKTISFPALTKKNGLPKDLQPTE